MILTNITYIRQMVLMLKLNLTDLSSSEISQIKLLIVTEIFESILVSSSNNTVFRTALATLGLLIRTRTQCFKKVGHQKALLLIQNHYCLS